ncbi:Coiled-coil domain-containing protein 75 [Morus notabilis]|uniref:Coiled-coil domain-containing protein 75 n=1 Tax=Morus notabilis TaxID=981085 RepID=W9S7R3_9ROSA|nr:Coiled-coil domain-containing protein 75 [Morus notabilis]
MAEFAEKQTTTNGEQVEDEDYMGDLSQFLPPESENPPKSLSKKTSRNETLAAQPSKKSKKANALNWQEHRKLERARKQVDEDEQTLAKTEAPIPQSNIGFKLLKQMGYTPGSALGREGSGRAEPLGLEIRRSRAGIGREDPEKEKRKIEAAKAEMKRKRDEVEAEIRRGNEKALMEDFGSRQKSQWRSRRVVVNFEKARAALDQLENREVVVPKKSEDDEGEGEDEEDEEEEITEEYESMEALLANCPGTDEDDH